MSVVLLSDQAPLSGLSFDTKRIAGIDNVDGYLRLSFTVEFGDRYTAFFPQQFRSYWAHQYSAVNKNQAGEVEKVE